MVEVLGEGEKEHVPGLRKQLAQVEALGEVLGKDKVVHLEEPIRDLLQAHRARLLMSLKLHFELSADTFLEKSRGRCLYLRLLRISEERGRRKQRIASRNTSSRRCQMGDPIWLGIVWGDPEQRHSQESFIEVFAKQGGILIVKGAEHLRAATEKKAKKLWGLSQADVETDVRCGHFVWQSWPGSKQGNTFSSGRQHRDWP
jgi:hypothetical protein